MIYMSMSHIVNYNALKGASASVVNNNQQSKQLVFNSNRSKYHIKGFEICRIYVNNNLHYFNNHKTL